MNLPKKRLGLKELKRSSPVMENAHTILVKDQRPNFVVEK
jgi:hypothetical protein